MLAICSQGFAQCLTSGPNSPSSVSNGTGIGSIAWIDLTNAQTSNNLYATATALVIGDKTNYLRFTNFGFSIPTTATICGISIEIEKKATGLALVNVTDESVRIIKGGTIVGSDYADTGTDWASSDFTSSYGGSSDLWGTTWTPSDINASDFGVALSAELASLSVLPTAQADHAQMTVYYDNSLPIKLLNFEAERTSDDLVKLIWETESETDNDFFTIERSTDGEKWEERGRLAGAGTSNERLSYSLTDKNRLNTTSYYRLKQTDFNGDFEYSKMVSVHPLGLNSSTVSIFPVPSSGIFTIKASEEILQLDVYNLWGENMFSKEDVGADHLNIDLSHKRKDVYFVKVRTSHNVITKRIVIK